MKKLYAVFLTAGLVLSIAGCGNSDPAASTVSPTPETQSESPVPPSSASVSSEVTIEEQVLYEKNNIKITAKSLDLGALFGPEIKVLVENQSEIGVTVQIRNFSINGYMADTTFSCDVAAGKKTNDSITIMKRSLEDCNIETITDIEFSFHIFDEEKWDTLDDSEIIRIETSAISSYTQNFDDSGEVLVDQEGIRIIYKYVKDDVMGADIVLYLENNSEKAVTVQQRDMSINGFMISGIFSCDLMPGKKAVDGISLLQSYLDENEITELEEGEISFHVFTLDGWDTLFDTEPVTIKF